MGLASHTRFSPAFAFSFALTVIAASAETPSSWSERVFTPFDVPDFFLRRGSFSPGQCAVLVFADGLGERHASLEPLVGLGSGAVDETSTTGSSAEAATPRPVRDNGNASRPLSWWRGRTVAPWADSTSPVGGLRGGCDKPLWHHFARGGASYGLLTTKCANDGLSAGFLVSTPDRYDLRAASDSIASLRPAPFLVSGGFSRALWRSASELPFVEFDTAGASAFGETCEYPPPETLPERAARAVRLGVSSGGPRGFFLAIMDADVDLASHAGDAKRVNASVRALRRVLDETVETLAHSCVGAWRVVVVGSRATGGASGGAAGEHRHHSPAGTPVPVFAIGLDEMGKDIAETLLARGRDAIEYDEVSRLVAPRLSCGSAASPLAPTKRRLVVHRPDAEPSLRDASGGNQRSPHRYRGTNRHDHDSWEVSVYVFFVSVSFLTLCLCLCLPKEDEHTFRVSLKNPNANKRYICNEIER